MKISEHDTFTFPHEISPISVSGQRDKKINQNALKVEISNEALTGITMGKCCINGASVGQVWDPVGL